MNVFKTVVNRFLVVLIAGFLMGGAAPHAWASGKLEASQLIAMDYNGIDSIILVMELLARAEKPTSTSSQGAWAAGIGVNKFEVRDKNGKYVKIAWGTVPLRSQEIGALTTGELVSPHYVTAKRRVTIRKADIIAVTGSSSGTAMVKIGIEAGIGRYPEGQYTLELLAQAIDKIIFGKVCNSDTGDHYGVIAY